MRITLAQWVEYGLRTAGGYPDCHRCQTRHVPSAGGVNVNLCPYHEGFVDGFDAAKGEK